MKLDRIKQSARLSMALGILAIGLVHAVSAMNPALADQPNTIEEALPVGVEYVEGNDTEPVILQPVTPPVPALPGEIPPYVAPADVEIHDDILVSPMRGSSSAWPGGIVPIVFDGITASEMTTHLQAMDQWNYSNANVTFVHRGSEANYIRFVPTTGSNSSYVGMLGGEQELKVNDPDVMTGAHELCHALGFEHEQSRPDRSSYVDIICGNIEPDKYHNFTIGTEWVFPIQTPYDYNSIMHYGECAFSVCEDLLGSCPCIGACESGDGEGYCAGGTCEHNGRTIVTLDNDFQDNIGQRDNLSPLDILDMQNGYGSGGMNKQYAQAVGAIPSIANSGIHNPSGFPRDLMVLHPNDTIWLRGGSYNNTVSAGLWLAPGVLRAHGGSVVLGGG